MKRPCLRLRNSPAQRSLAPPVTSSSWLTRWAAPALCGLLCTVCLALGQIGPRPPPLHRTRDGDLRLPNGKSQREEMLKEDHKKTLADAAELVKLAGALQTD